MSQKSANKCQRSQHEVIQNISNQIHPRLYFITEWHGMWQIISNDFNCMDTKALRHMLKYLLLCSTLNDIWVNK